MADLALAGGLVLWLVLGFGAARQARGRGYPVIWLSVLLGPVGWAAMVRLTGRSRLPLSDRHGLMQQAAAGQVGVKVTPDRLPWLSEALAEAERTGRLEDLWLGVADYVRYERFWDRSLPWMVLVLGGSTLAGAALGVLPTALGASDWWGLAAIPGAAAGFGLGARLLTPLEEALVRGRDEALSRCAVRAGRPGPPEHEGAAAEAAERLWVLRSVARGGAALAVVGAAALLLLRAAG